jgi:uncharacterized protein (UPF0332 family)
MTGDNRQANVGFEWARVDEAVREVDTLMGAELWSAAVSRAYYGMFHAARALAFSEGLEVRTHAGLVHLLSANLVRSGRFPSEMIRLLSQTQRMREDADYETALTFDRLAADDARTRLSAFRSETERFLRDGGYR